MRTEVLRRVRACLRACVRGERCGGLRARLALKGEGTSTPGGEKERAEPLAVGAGLRGVPARWPQFSLEVGGKVMRQEPCGRWAGVGGGV